MGFVSRRLVLISPLAPAAAVGKLRAVVAKPLGWQQRLQPGQWKRNGGFMGRVQDSGDFDIRRDINYRNSFLPLVFGQIRQDDYSGGSRITVHMRMHRAVAIFMFFWLGMVGLSALGFLLPWLLHGTSPLSRPGDVPGIFIPVGMFLFGLALPYFAFRPEANKAEAFLHETLQASAVPADSSRIAV